MGLSSNVALVFSDDTSKDSIIKEVYTFNSPGAKNLKIDEDTLGRVYEIDSTILNAKDKERALFKKYEDMSMERKVC